MVTKKRLQKYLDKQLKSMQTDLDDMSKEVDKDKLHNLRLHAKKVKAVSGFLKASLHDKNKYSIKELKEVFHTNGDIRTAQLNLESVEDYQIKNEAFENEQKQVIEQDSNTIV